MRRMVPERLEAHHAPPKLHISIKWCGRSYEASRVADEDVQKTLDRLAKKLKINTCGLLGSVKMSNFAAFSSARFLSMPHPHEDLPVYFNPPKIDSAELSTPSPYTSVPISCNITTYGEPDVSLTFEWSQDGSAEVLSTSKLYTPTEVDIDATLVLKITPERDGLHGETHIVKTDEPVRRLPKTLIDKISRWGGKVSKEGFRVATYNVLAEQYAAGSASGREAYGHVPEWVLPMRYRAQAVLKEILTMDADIVSLQEVGGTHYKRLVMVLREHGYDGWYVRKLRDGTEGCAVFWKTTRFDLVSKREVPLGGDVDTIPLQQHVKNAVKTDEKLMEEFTWVVSKLQFCEFFDKTTKSTFTYANTHLYYHPLGAFIRALQMTAIFNTAEEFGCDKFFLTGDLNTVCHPYKVKIRDGVELIKITSGRVERVFSRVEGGVAVDGVVMGPGDVAYNPSTGVLSIRGEGIYLGDRHTVDTIASVFGADEAFTIFPTHLPPTAAHRLLQGDTISPTDRDMHLPLTLSLPLTLTNPNPDLPYTCHSPNFTEVLDYILYPKGFRVTGRMPRLDYPTIREEVKGFPCEWNPSDHMALYADFAVEEYAVPLKMAALC